MNFADRPVAFTMHSFMDAADVAPAWAARQHSVLDPAENAALRTVLPMPTTRAGA